MAQNITLMGASYSDVPSVQLPKTGGGIATFDDTTIASNAASASDISSGKQAWVNGSLVTGTNTGVPYIWQGENIGSAIEVYPLTTYALDSTNYLDWTPSNSAATMMSTSIVYTFSGDLTLYDYILKWQYDMPVVYRSGTVKKAAPDRQICVLWQVVTKRAGNDAQLTSGVPTTNQTITAMTAQYLGYYNTNGTRTMTYTSSYGLYIAATGATFSSSTSNTPTIRVRTPTLNARCNDNYFSTSMAAAVDARTTLFKLKGEMYTVNAKTTDAYNTWAAVRDIFLNPL